MSKHGEADKHKHGHKEDAQERAVEREPAQQRMIEKMYANFGETLGWKNITTDQNKIADTEILLVTGGDLEFLLMHHKVRDLLEANAVFGDVLFKGYEEPEDIYKRLADKSPMLVELLDGTGRKVDLRDMARLLRMEEKNRYLGANKFKTEELRDLFLNGEGRPGKPGWEIPVKFEEEEDGKKVIKDKIVDLRNECPVDNLEDFNFETYINKIEKNQIGLQYLGELRDEVLDKHHIENASNSLFIATGRYKYNGKPKYLFMPVSATLAARDGRADLQKKDATFKAAGHVHEFANYCEANGTTVKIDPALLRKHRGEVSLRQLERTLPRTFRAAVGLERDEEMTVISNEDVPGHEDKGKMNIAVIGGNRKGKIYKGLHYTYDKAMKDVRGYGLTDKEADDLIFTDIIAPFIYANPTDWLMCFAKSSGGQLGYKAEKAVVQGGDRWDEYGRNKEEGPGTQKFCVAIPCKDGDPKTGLKYFFNYSDLINYVNERIRKGEIEGVKSNVTVTYEGMTQEQADQELLDKSEDELAAEQGVLENMLPAQQKSFVSLMKKIFKSDTEAVLQSFADNGVDGQIEVNKKAEIFSEYLKEQLRSKDFKEITELTGSTNKQAKEKLFFVLLKRLTSEMRVDILQLAKTGEIQPGREEPEIDKKILNLINQEELYTQTGEMRGVTEFQKALGDVAGFIKQADPDAIEEETDTSGLKELRLVDPHKKGWSKVLHTMKMIILAHKDNETVRNAIGDKINDVKWLFRQSLLVARKSKLLDGLSL